MSDIDRITAMLSDDAMEKQIAAAIVLGELRAKGAAVVDGLVKMVQSGAPPLQRHALEALARIGAKRAVPAVFPLLAAGNADVRAAAARAVASVGDEVVPMVQARMSEAGPDEKRALDAVLAELGGKEAFSALLEGLAAGDEEGGKAAAIAVRQRVRAADPKERRSYLAQVEKFLGKKSTQASPTAVGAALKILGYLEDDKATKTLLKYAKDRKAAASVKQEALIALRFVLGENGEDATVIDALFDAAEAPDRALAHTALHTLGTLPLSGRLAKRFAKLALHPETERARFAIEQLGRLGGEVSVAALVEILSTAERRRAEIAAAALGRREEAIPLLAKALLAADDPDRAWMIRKTLGADAKKIAGSVRKQLLGTALDRLAEGERGWEAALEVARDADPKGTSTALRDLGAKLRKSKKIDRAETVFRMLSRTESAGDEDRYALASLALSKGRRDTNPMARANDEALRTLATLADRGYDVAGALRKDRALELDDLYYVGFHFVEQGHPLGEDLLTEVAEKAGRTKLGKMAKNKLALLDR